MKKRKAILLMIGFSIAFYYLYGILLPFILGMLLAFSAKPIITRIQKIVKNKGLATTIFLGINTGIIILFFVFFTNYIKLPIAPNVNIKPTVLFDLKIFKGIFLLKSFNLYI